MNRQFGKLLAVILALFLASGMLSGCETASAQGESGGESGELEEGWTEVYGKVRSANGNEIILAIGEPASPGQGGPEGGDTGEGAAPEGEEPVEGMEPPEERERPAGEEPGERGGGPGRGAGGESGERPALSGEENGEAGPPSGGPREEEGEGRPGGGAPGGMGVTLEYTGEEITYLIPVTATITTGQGENARSVRFTQIAEKNIVRLVLDAGGEVTAVQILG